MQKAQQQDLEDLRQTVFEFHTDLGDIFTSKIENGDFVIMEFFYKHLPKEVLMQYAIEKLLPFKPQIKERNIQFFNQNTCVFSGLPEDRVAYYRDMIVTQKRLSEDDLSMIWEYLDTMLALAESYKKYQ
jgi:hypothetical protein